MTLTEAIQTLDTIRKNLIMANALWSQGTTQANVDAAGYEQAAWSALKRMTGEFYPSK